MCVAAAIAGAGVVGSVASGVIGSNAAGDAAQTQADAANNAAALQNQQWQQTQANLKPYLELGSGFINPLVTALGYTMNGLGNVTGTIDSNPLQQKFSYADFQAPTAAEAAATPGYQFTLDQGLKSVQNGAAARGLGTSGAAMKGAANYATGLADSTYNDVFNRALNTYNTNLGKAQSTFQTNYNSAANNANRLLGVVGNGQNAAATNGSLGAAAVGNIGNTLTSGANAQASGIVGGANALSGALGSLGSGAMTYGLLNNNALASATAANPTYGTTAAGNPIYFQV